MSSASESLLLLRSITKILTTTPEPSLPSQIPSIASLLYSSPVLDAALALSTDAAQRHKAEEAAVLTHKFRTRVSALLQSKISQARWSGVVLVKCAVESSFEALAAWGGLWARLLGPLVTRPEPPATTVMTIRTLARIFTVLTESKPSLTREIATPCLPGFFAALLLALESGERRVLAVTLEALRDVVRAHAVTFRPFATKARITVLLVIARAGEEERLAREVLVALHLCASKRGAQGAVGGRKMNAVTSEWGAGIETVLGEVHAALDTVLEPIVEEYDFRPTQRTESSLGLEAVVEGGGIPEQVERLLLLLRVLKSYFTSAASVQPHIPLARIIEAAARILSVNTAFAANPAVEKIYREHLFSLLPRIHASALDLIDTLAQRLGMMLLPFIPMLLEYTVSAFSENAHSKVAVFTTTSTLLGLSGPALSPTTITALNPVLTAACLLPSSASSAAPPPSGKQHADLLLPSSTPTIFSPPGLAPAASDLLATALAKLPPHHMRADIRARLERTAIATSNQPALLAAVLYPRPDARAGLIPHLVAGIVTLAEEALVRPRMPVVWTGPRRDEVRREIEEARERAEHERQQERSSKRPRTFFSSPSPPPPSRPSSSPMLPPPPPPLSPPGPLPALPTRSIFSKPPLLSPGVASPPPRAVSPEKPPVPSPPQLQLQRESLGSAVIASASASAFASAFPSAAASSSPTAPAVGTSPVKPAPAPAAVVAMAVDDMDVSDDDELMVVPEIDMGESDSDSDGGSDDGGDE